MWFAKIKLQHTALLFCTKRFIAFKFYGSYCSNNNKIDYDNEVFLCLTFDTANISPIIVSIKQCNKLKRSPIPWRKFLIKTL
jgi:hypothetical protein